MKRILMICLVPAMLAAILGACTPVSKPATAQAPGPAGTAAVAAPVSAAGAASSGDTQRVNSADGKATLAYPAAWKVMSTSPSLVVGDAPLAGGKSSPAGSGPAHYAALVTQPTDPEVPPTRAQLVDMARSDLQSACTSDQLTAAAEDVQIDGRPGIWLYCRGQIDGRPVHASVAYAERTGMMVGLFMLAYDDGPWAQSKPAFEKMIKGLTFVQ